MGDRAVMINDDKPLVKIAGDKAVIYGTPWNGKHHLGANISAPLKYICFLNRGEDNVISSMDRAEALTRLLKFTFRPDAAAETAAVLETAEKLSDCVEFRSLYCNMDPEAVKVSYEGMMGKQK